MLGHETRGGQVGEDGARRQSFDVGVVDEGESHEADAGDEDHGGDEPVSGGVVPQEVLEGTEGDRCVAGG